MKAPECCGAFEPSDDMVPMRCTLAAGHVGDHEVWSNGSLSIRQTTWPQRSAETQSDEHRGLYRKYDVRRVSDPTGKHASCEYFVLDLKHDKYAFDALQAYALACREELPQLSSDLLRRSVGERSDELSRTAPVTASSCMCKCGRCRGFAAHDCGLPDCKRAPAEAIPEAPISRPLAGHTCPWGTPGFFPNCNACVLDMQAGAKKGDRVSASAAYCPDCNGEAGEAHHCVPRSASAPNTPQKGRVSHGSSSAPTGPRGKAGEVTVVDIAGDGTGPWRLFIGEYGVADWPCTHDPRAYALTVARGVRAALVAWRDGSTPSPLTSADTWVAWQMELVKVTSERNALQVQLDEARRVIASLRAELEDVKVDRDSADQALDRERARTPETFSELQAQTLQGAVPGRATSNALPDGPCDGCERVNENYVEIFDAARDAITHLRKGEHSMAEHTLMRAMALRIRPRTGSPQPDVIAALESSIEFAEEGWSYASDYFKEKWDYEGHIAELRAALAVQRADHCAGPTQEESCQQTRSQEPSSSSSLSGSSSPGASSPSVAPRAPGVSLTNEQILAMDPRAQAMLLGAVFTEMPATPIASPTREEALAWAEKMKTDTSVLAWGIADPSDEITAEENPMDATGLSSSPAKPQVILGQSTPKPGEPGWAMIRVVTLRQLLREVLDCAIPKSTRDLATGMALGLDYQHPETPFTSATAKEKP